MTRWYVVYTHANAEGRALSNLLRQGYNAYFPQYKKVRRHARKTDTVRKPLFPRYLFVALDVSHDLWRPILSTYGVCYLIGSEKGPEPVPEGLVETIRSHGCDEGTVHPLRLTNPEHGLSVEVESGPFVSQIGRLVELDNDGRVTVLMNILGHDLSVRLPIETVSAA